MCHFNDDPLPSERAKPYLFKAGDTVKHGPTGETWILKRDEEDGHVWPCGWPETRARAADCTIIR